MRPTREKLRGSDYAYFISTQTAERKPFFRHERWAQLIVATIRNYAGENFTLHAFVVMPDHLHLLITPPSSVEKAVQLIKGGFSYRARRQLGWTGEVWQPGFTDHRIRDEADWKRHLEYIRSNPVDARLAEDSILYQFMGFPDVEFPQRLKPVRLGSEDVRAEARTLRTEARALCAEASTPQAEARTFCAEASTPQAEAPNLRAEASTPQAEIRTLRTEAHALQAEAPTLQVGADALRAEAPNPQAAVRPFRSKLRES